MSSSGSSSGSSTGSSTGSSPDVSSPDDTRRDRPLRLFRQRSRAGAAAPPAPGCEHLAQYPVVTAEHPGAGCQDHTPQDGPVVHLRLCLACDHIACCDSSHSQHATRHARESGHPVMQSIEAGESWRWCYLHELLG